MPLLHFLSDLRTDDSMVLRIFGEVESADRTKGVIGTAGFIGTLLIFFAILSTFWAALDPTVDIRPLFAYSVELFGGLGLALGFGFTFARKTDLNREIQAALLGLFAGIVIIATQSAVYALSGLLPFSADIMLVLLAPVAETMLFTVAFYHLFKFHFPELSWLQIAVTSDVSFAMYHFFAYGYRADFWLILIILLIGNTILMWIYASSMNATAPMVAHFIVNFAVVGQDALAAILPNIGVVIALFVLFILIYLFVGRLRQQ